jgi:alkyl hydroperoxide reductase subunit AhpF
VLEAARNGPAGRQRVLHCWGHSWEFEGLGLWHEFEACVAALAQVSARTDLTNGELGDRVRAG